MHFTTPTELLTVGHSSSEPLTRQHLVHTYEDVLMPQSKHSQTRFVTIYTKMELRCRLLCTMFLWLSRDAVKAQLDEYEPQCPSQPSQWISTIVTVRQPEKLGICTDPKSLNLALKRSQFLI